jgi:hypothetical protein
LFLEAFFVSFDFITALLIESLLRLALLEFLVKTLRHLLLTAGLIADSENLRLDLKDLVIFLFNKFLDRLQSLISLLHTKECLLPVFK